MGNAESTSRTGVDDGITEGRDGNVTISTSQASLFEGGTAGGGIDVPRNPLEPADQKGAEAERKRGAAERAVDRASDRVSGFTESIADAADAVAESLNQVIASASSSHTDEAERGWGTASGSSSTTRRGNVLMHSRGKTASNGKPKTRTVREPADLSPTAQGVLEGGWGRHEVRRADDERFAQELGNEQLVSDTVEVSDELRKVLGEIGDEDSTEQAAGEGEPLDAVRSEESGSDGVDGGSDRKANGFLSAIAEEPEASESVAAVMGEDDSVAELNPDDEEVSRMSMDANESIGDFQGLDDVESAGDEEVAGIIAGSRRNGGALAPPAGEERPSSAPPSETPDLVPGSGSRGRRASLSSDGGDPSPVPRAADETEFSPANAKRSGTELSEQSVEGSEMSAAFSGDEEVVHR